jgi:hypothetical protein
MNKRDQKLIHQIQGEKIGSEKTEWGYNLDLYRYRVFAQDQQEAIITAWERALSTRHHVFGNRGARRAPGQSSQYFVVIEVQVWPT